MKQNKKLVGLAVAMVMAVAAYWLWAPSGPGQVRAEAKFVAQPVDSGTIRRSVSASGSVRPLITVEIGSQLSGQVLALMADFNDEVEAGQLLARIDPQTFATKVKQTEAELAVANASVSVQKANVTRAKAQLREAERTYARQKDLYDQGNISISALESYETALIAARAEVESSEAQLENAKATVSQREAALDQAQIDLGRTEIRSPIKGTVIERSVDVGQTVAASLSAPTLFELAQDLSEIQIEAAVDEADIGSVKPGNRVAFSVDAFPDQSFTGKVKQIRLAPVEQSNVVTYTVIISAHNEDRSLLPGMTANVEIFTGEKQDVLRLPNEALRFRPSVVPDIAAERQTTSGGTNPVDRLQRDLNLNEDQVARLRDGLAAVRAQLMGGASQGGGIAMGPPPGGGTQDRVQMRQKFEAARDKILKEILTADQWTAYEAQKAQRGTIREAQVWLLDAGGALKPVLVLLGLSDDSHTEVLRGLDAGAQVVVREEARKG